MHIILSVALCWAINFGFDMFCTRWRSADASSKYFSESVRKNVLSDLPFAVPRKTSTNLTRETLNVFFYLYNNFPLQYGSLYISCRSILSYFYAAYTRSVEVIGRILRGCQYLVLTRQVSPTSLRIFGRKLEFDVSPTPTHEVGGLVGQTRLLAT